MNYKKLVLVGVGLFTLAAGALNFIPLSSSKAHAASSFTWVDAKTVTDENHINYIFQKNVQGGSVTVTSGRNTTTHALYEAIFVAQSKTANCTVNTKYTQQDGSYTYNNKDLNNGGAGVVIFQMGTSQFDTAGTSKVGQASYIGFANPTNPQADSACQTSNYAHVSVDNPNNASSIKFNWYDTSTIVNVTDGTVYKNNNNTQPTYFYATNSGNCHPWIQTTGQTSGDYYDSRTSSKSGYTKQNNCYIKNTGSIQIGHPENLNTQGSATSGPVTTSGSGSGNGDGAVLDCGGGVLNWIICPFITLAQGAAEKLDNYISSTLTIDVNQTFNASYYKAWNSFRLLATAILVIAGLVMVGSQALGFDFLDAYTVRKVLPRMITAIIGMTLSWPLLKFGVGLFNTIGNDVYGLITGPFVGIHATINPGIGALSSLLVPAAGVAALFAFGPAALLIIVSGLLGLFMAFMILVIRQIAVVAIVILAPIAIACYILPNTQKAWDIWKDNFLGLMLMFPIVMAFIAAGHAFATVSINHGGGISTIIGIIAYFIPYFLLPLAFKLATGIIGTISGMVNDRSKGVFDRMKGIRQNAAKQRHQMRMNDQMSKGAVGNAYRRFGSLGTPNSGALSMTRQGRANYAALRQQHLQAVAAEALKNDNGRAAGDDDATALAVQHGMTRAKFLRDYQDRTGRDAASASAALALVERGFGAQMGTEAMQVAAFKARAASSTSYSGDEAGTQQRINEGAALINAGLMTEADATAAGKGNRARVDINGAGFNTQMTAFRAAAAAQRAGGTGMTSQQATKYLDTTLQEADPGDLLAGNTRTIDALAPAMTRNLQRALDGRADAIARDDTDDIEHFDLQVNRALGQIAGVQDNLNRTSPQKAGKFADQVNGALVTDLDGSQVTVRKMVADAASRPAGKGGFQTFLEVRKEYGNAREAKENEMPQRPDEAEQP